MERKQAKDLQVGDECYLVSPYCKSKILKVTEVLRTIDGNKYKVRFNDGSFCIMYYNIRYEEVIMDRLEAHFDVVGDNMYENAISCIEWLIKKGYFPKEYLVNQAEIDEHCKGVLKYLDYIRGEEE